MAVAKRAPARPRPHADLIAKEIEETTQTVTSHMIQREFVLLAPVNSTPKHTNTNRERGARRESLEGFSPESHPISQKKPKVGEGYSAPLRLFEYD